MCAIFSYPYQEDVEPSARGIEGVPLDLYRAVEGGKRPAAAADTGNDIKEKNKECEVLVVVLGEDYVGACSSQEIGAANGPGSDLILIAGGDGGGASTLTGHYHVPRSDGDAALCISISGLLNLIKKCRGGRADSPVSLDAPDDELISEDWPEEVREKFSILKKTFRVENKKTFRVENYGKALKQATRFAAEHPECWRFYIAISSALINQRRFDEAREVLESVLKKFAGTPRALSYAYDNMGWLVDQESAEICRESLEGALSYHKAAKKAERRPTVYLNIVQCLLELRRVAEAEAEFTEWQGRDSDAVKKLHAQIEIQGARFVKAVSKSDVLLALLFPRGGSKDA